MKEKTTTEQYAENWFSKNGFTFHLKKQLLSKTIYEVEKDGVKDVLYLHYDVPDIKSYMDQYEKNFLVLKELNELRKKVREMEK